MPQMLLGSSEAGSLCRPCYQLLPRGGCCM